MLPIPGPQSIDHLEENVLAAGIKLAPEDFRDLEQKCVQSQGMDKRAVSLRSN
jgi:aryl-alcohol dehydrogenase-like predicted oxidoreductase